MLRTLLTLSVLLCSVYAQLPRPCESPREWEGDFSRYDVDRKAELRAKITYDANMRRVREIEEVEIGSTKDFYDVLRLYNERKEYRLNLKTQSCNVTTLTRPFLEIGLPPDAKFTAEFVIGLASLPNEHVNAVAFNGTFADGNYFGIVSTPSCIPIRFGIDSQQYGFEDTRFLDIKAGIPDPSVFIPPSQCSS